jgi:hypothetical protein
MALPALESFFLVGGTNLALRLGHRISVDIDLFTTDSFDLNEVRGAIADTFSHAIELSARNQTLLYQINGVKTDLILHKYDEIRAVEKFDTVRLASLPDVVAMKLGAVAGRGAKKDFWDIHALLAQFSVKQMIDFYTRKYPLSDPGQVVRSLVYFEDAEPQQDPIDLLNVTWPEVKANILDHVRSYTNSMFD